MQEEMRYINRNSDQYPARLRDLPHMPDGLYVKGNLPDDNAPSVAIVGARMCSGYGRNTAFAFGKKMAECGISVISGMAIGIDGAAQEGALAGGGKTFAVLGCGADVCYPRSNINLYSQLPQHGGIISEFEPGTKPFPYNFPLRNRLISALSDVVVVVEAREKSGSLITVDYALEQGKSVYAVPGRVGDALSDGCNYLIAQGAGIAWSAEAILEEIRMQSSLSHAARAAREAALEKLRMMSGTRMGAAKERREEPEGMPHLFRSEDGGQNGAGEANHPSENGKGCEGKTLREKILICLGNDEKTMEEMMRELGVPVTEMNAALGEMMLYGEIEEAGRNRYSRNRN
ncbi:MAG: DNA-processing protein DprA [Lachnospiraceae bacterium]|nr:DNA-processing protein DprA [Lachnospiraceae bacterium]